MVTDGVFVTDHEVRLPVLVPDTRYYYAIGTTLTTLAGGLDYNFQTAPTAAKPTRIWVLGDSGTGDFRAAQVADAYYFFAQGEPPDVWLMLGDNAYYQGFDAEYQRGVFDMYPDMLRRVSLWSTIGNHETYSADTNGRFPYLDIFSLPTHGEAGALPQVPNIIIHSTTAISILSVLIPRFPTGRPAVLCSVGYSRIWQPMTKTG